MEKRGEEVFLPLGGRRKREGEREEEEEGNLKLWRPPRSRIGGRGSHSGWRSRTKRIGVKLGGGQEEDDRVALQEEE